MTATPRRKTKGRYVAYMRVSTKDQKEGLPAQRQAITTWAAKEGVVISEWYEEVVSGKLDLYQRPELVRAVGLLKEGDKLVVVRRDRLARNIVTAAICEKMAAKVGATIIATDGGDFGDGPEGLLLRTIIDAIGEYERMLIIARTKAALTAKKMRGEVIGGIPYGQRVIEGTKLLAPNPKEQAVIARILELRRAGTTHHGIVAALNESGERTRKGTPWRLILVQRILSDNGLTTPGARALWGTKRHLRAPTGRPPGRPKGSKTKRKVAPRPKVPKGNLPPE